MTRERALDLVRASSAGGSETTHRHRRHQPGPPGCLSPKAWQAHAETEPASFKFASAGPAGRTVGLPRKLLPARALHRLKPPTLDPSPLAPPPGRKLRPASGTHGSPLATRTVGLSSDSVSHDDSGG